MLVVLGVYLLTMSGHTYSRDEETMLEASRALVVTGGWAINPSRSLVEVTGVDGRRYSQYGPGQSLAAAPWVAAGLGVGRLFPKDQSGYPLLLILGSYNALVAAGICGLLAALGMALGYGRRPSLILGGALAFATFLWPHSRTFFSEPLTALLLLASFYLLARARLSLARKESGPDRLPPLLIASGALFALMLATKVQYAVALPAFLLYLLWPLPSADAPEEQAGLVPGIAVGVRRLLPWGVGFALGMLPLLLYNWSVFGNPLVTGYGTDVQDTFKTPLLEGAYGLLLSPGKGLLWYAPPVLLSIWGFRRFWREHKAEAAAVLALSVLIVALFALYTFWHGDGSWGPRYLLPLLPFVLLAGLPVLQGFGSQTLTARLLSLAAAILLVTGFGINLLGVLVNFDTYINFGYDDETRHFQTYASPIVGHFNLLGQRLRLGDLRIGDPTGQLVFRSGFSYSEGDKVKNELLPRWTTGAGVFQLWPYLAHSSPQITLRLSDHRPPSLPRATLAILVNGKQVSAQAQPVPGAPVSTDYTFTAGGRPIVVTIQSDTWNPAKVGAAQRDEDIGLKVESMTVSENGQPRQYSMREAQPPPPYYPQPRWYYDPATPHLADLWPVYMAETGMDRKVMLALALPLVLVALGCLFFGKVSGTRWRLW